jgi:acetyl esterase/lipase
MDPWKAIEITSLEGVRKIKVQDGLIQSLEFSFTETSQSDLQIAMLRATQPTYTDIAYGEQGNSEQVLNIYLPQTGAPPYPVLFLIHGLFDERVNHRGMAGFLNQAGFAAVVIDYRMEHSLMVPDALCALAWTKANAGDYGLDPERITVFGYSIGGMAAATLGTLDDRSTALQGCAYPLPEQGGILGVALYEGIVGTPEWCFAPGGCEELWGIPLSEIRPIYESLHTTEPALWKDAEIVGSQTVEFARHFPLFWLDGSEPPFLLINGSGAESLPPIEAESFAKRLQEAGVDAQVLILPDATHGSVFCCLPNFFKVAQAVVDFSERLVTKRILTPRGTTCSEGKNHRGGWP